MPFLISSLTNFPIIVTEDQQIIWIEESTDFIYVVPKEEYILYWLSERKVLL
jgi:hypothetical protein